MDGMIMVTDVAASLQGKIDFLQRVKGKVEKFTEEQFLTVCEKFGELPDNFLVMRVLDNVVDADLRVKLLAMKLDDEQLATLSAAINANDETGGYLTMSEVVNYLDDEDLVRKLNLGDGELETLVAAGDLVPDNSTVMEIIRTADNCEGLADEFNEWSDEELYFLMGEVMELEDPE